MRSLIQNRPLFGRMLEFNFDPQRYIHLSWLSDLIPANREVKWQNCRRTKDAITSILLKKIGPVYDFTFSQSLKRITLLYHEELNELSEYIGLAISSRQIRQMIQKRRYAKIKNQLAEHKIQFALERAHLMTQGALPLDVVDDFYENPLFVSRKIGLLCLLKHANEYGEAVSKRFRLKLPRKLEYHKFEVPISETIDRVSTGSLILRILKTEMNDLWKQLFI